MSRAVQRIRVALGAANRRFDPPLLRRSLPCRAHGSVLVVGVYRKRNATILRTLLASCPDRARMSLWALDQVSPELAHITAGVGRGAKFELLDRLISTNPGSYDYVVVVDDDISVSRGSLSHMLVVMRLGDFDIAQPAHGRGSHSNYNLVRVRARSVARVTTFVEIGPLFVFSRAAARELLPFGEGVGMGWGLEQVWQHTAQACGLRMGVVDAVLVKHLAPAAAEYDWKAAQASGERLLNARGIPSAQVPPATEARWPSWRRKAPWGRTSW